MPSDQFGDLKSFLDFYFHKYNTADFIACDPIAIPHLFKSDRNNIEIMGFLIALLSWGQRKIILNKGYELVARMDHNPHNFILRKEGTHLKQLQGFVHRTFNEEDLLRMVYFLRKVYMEFGSIEALFLRGMSKEDITVEGGLNYFKSYFIDTTEIKNRTLKHVASPSQNSTCKRLNMYLRWMVRCDDKGVDFGIWTNIKPSQLVCPCDVHVNRVARKLNLIHRPTLDWNTAIELTDSLKKLDPKDPIKYDIALFGLGVEGII